MTIKLLGKNGMKCSKQQLLITHKKYRHMQVCTTNVNTTTPSDKKISTKQACMINANITTPSLIKMTKKIKIGELVSPGNEAQNFNLNNLSIDSENVLEKNPANFMAQQLRSLMELLLAIVSEARSCPVEHFTFLRYP